MRSVYAISALCYSIKVLNKFMLSSCMKSSQLLICLEFILTKIRQYSYWAATAYCMFLNI